MYVAASQNWSFLTWGRLNFGRFLPSPDLPCPRFTELFPFPPRSPVNRGFTVYGCPLKCSKTAYSRVNICMSLMRLTLQIFQITLQSPKLIELGFPNAQMKGVSGTRWFTGTPFLTDSGEYGHIHTDICVVASTRPRLINQHTNLELFSYWLHQKILFRAKVIAF
jgi:hypothetical protein